ncbi:MAG: hypothetical protein Fur0034_07180 [Desulfuromonadia bacterium]
MAPNLSGLLTPFYPPRQGVRFDPSTLRRWIENPRSLRPWTTMPPLRLTPDEMETIISILSDR